MRRLSPSRSVLPLLHLPHGASLILPFVTLGSQPLHVSVPRIRLSAMRI